jgi:hypothetical protein
MRASSSQRSRPPAPGRRKIISDDGLFFVDELIFYPTLLKNQGIQARAMRRGKAASFDQGQPTAQPGAATSTLQSSQQPAIQPA